jgi:hypothetical protein
MKKAGFYGVVVLGLLGFLMVTTAFAAYHHEGERDADKFLSVYPDKAGTKLDHCALCHSGGVYESKGRPVSLGSCQWCHHSYGYDGSGNIEDTMNAYGHDYKASGRNADAVRTIETFDSDADGSTNLEEISANSFPGNPDDDPSLIAAPYRIYTRQQLAALGGHTQFLLMNTSRSGDFYAQYTGIPLEVLLQDAGILDSASGITVFAPDGWSQYHPLQADPDPELYPVRGVYPAATYHYDEEADTANNPTDGWCDYSAPSCTGRNNGDSIAVAGGLKMILAYRRDGIYLDSGILNQDNKLDGEGPFRVVPPQKNPSPPDQSSRAANQNVIWPYDYDWDHNAGAATRTVTIIRVEPLPAGTTDIDLLEAGWAYVDQEKIIVYGAIDGTDTDQNGVLDSEEGTGDYDGDGAMDFEDPDTTCVRHAMGGEKLVLHTSRGAFAEVKCRRDNDPEIPQLNKPSVSFPYGTTQFKITGLNAGETVTVRLMFPDNVPTTAKYYKIDAASGWREIAFGSNDGDETITLSLTDGDPLTDADGLENGEIDDPGALAATSGSTAGAGSGGGGGGSSCFITSAAASQNSATSAIWLAVIMLIGGGVFRICRAIRGGSQ